MYPEVDSQSVNQQEGMLISGDTQLRIPMNDDDVLQYKKSSYCTHLSSPSVCACRSLLPASLPYLGGPLSYHHQSLSIREWLYPEWLIRVPGNRTVTYIGWLKRTDKPSLENTTRKGLAMLDRSEAWKSFRVAFSVKTWQNLRHLRICFYDKSDKWYLTTSREKKWFEEIICSEHLKICFSQYWVPGTRIISAKQLNSLSSTPDPLSRPQSQ